MEQLGCWTTARETQVQISPFFCERCQATLGQSLSLSLTHPTYYCEDETEQGRAMYTLPL